MRDCYKSSTPCPQVILVVSFRRARPLPAVWDPLLDYPRSDPDTSKAHLLICVLSPALMYKKCASGRLLVK